MRSCCEHEENMYPGGVSRNRAIKDAKRALRACGIRAKIPSTGRGWLAFVLLFYSAAAIPGAPNRLHFFRKRRFEERTSNPKKARKLLRKAGIDVILPDPPAVVHVDLEPKVETASDADDPIAATFVRVLLGPQPQAIPASC